MMVPILRDERKYEPVLRFIREMQTENDDWKHLCTLVIEEKTIDKPGNVFAYIMEMQ